MSLTVGGFWGIPEGICDTFIDQYGVTEYRNCRLGSGGQTGPSSSVHGSDPPSGPIARPVQDRTTTRSSLTTSENETSTYIPSSTISIHATSTHFFPDVPASTSYLPTQFIQRTSVSTATVTISSESLNPRLTVTQTSTSIVESTQRRGAGLSVGATVGIIVAILVFALLASAGSWLLWKRRRRHTTALSHNLLSGSTSALWRTSYGDEALPPYVPSRSEGTKGPVSESEKKTLPALPQYGYTLDEPQVQYGSEIACDGTSIYGPDDISRLSPLRPLRRVE